MASLRLVLLALLCALGGCSSDDVAGDGGPDALGSADAAGAMPINAPPGQWTFVPVGGNACDDGSATGIGVNPADTDKLLVYFEGGGACGDFFTCYILNTAVHGPFGAAQLPVAVNRPGSIFDRQAAGNPFSSYTLVYVPYCTGDVHGGVNVVIYTDGANPPRTYYHVGHTNALAALDRLAATWPALAKLVVTGASAGGYGSVLNYDAYRARWPAAASYLIDDSGPLLRPDATPQLLEDWFTSWGILEWYPCTACATDLSAIYPFLAGRHTADRMALLSSLQDQVIRLYFMLDAAAFQAAIEALTTQVLDPLPHVEHFIVQGSSHTMLGHPADFTAGTTGLWTWLTQMVTDDAAWQSAP